MTYQTLEAITVQAIHSRFAKKRSIATIILIAGLYAVIIIAAVTIVANHV